MSDLLHEQCPKWCQRTHHVRSGLEHRVEIGRLDVREQRFTVVVHQTPTYDARVAISGPVYVHLADDDLDDARALFTALGFPFLAQLLAEAQSIVEPFNHELRLARVEQENG